MCGAQGDEVNRGLQNYNRDTNNRAKARLPSASAISDSAIHAQVFTTPCLDRAAPVISVSGLTRQEALANIALSLLVRQPTFRGQDMRGDEDHQLGVGGAFRARAEEASDERQVT